MSERQCDQLIDASALENGVWVRPYRCTKPVRERGKCAQHARMAKGLSGKWVGASDAPERT